MIGAQFRSVTEIAPKSLFPYLNRSPSRYGFRAGAKTFRYSVNVAFATLKRNKNTSVLICGTMHYLENLFCTERKCPGGGGGTPI